MKLLTTILHILLFQSCLIVQYFQIADSKKQVKSSIGIVYTDEILNEEVLGYGRSQVKFKNGIIQSYSNNSINLKLCEQKVNDSIDLEIGSTKTQVAASFGNPDKIYTIDILNEEEWTYGKSMSKFKCEQIESYSSTALQIKSNQSELSNIKKKEISVNKNLDPELFVLTFVGTEIIYNNHVGNEWLSYCKVNGKELYYKENITLNMEAMSSVSIVSYLHETEEKYNDSSSEKVIVSKSELSQYRGTGFYVIVTIRESNGRYAGNTAQMKFYYNVD